MNRRAFSLVEMLVVLGLLTFAGMLAGKLFIACMELSSIAEKHQLEALHRHEMFRRLREDVWDAQRLRVDEAGVLRIDGTATWQIMDNAVQRRAAGTEKTHHWPHLSEGLSWRVEGPRVIARVDPPGMAAAREYHLISQTMLNQEAAQ